MIKKQERGYRAKFNVHLFSQTDLMIDGQERHKKLCQDERVDKFRFVIERGSSNNNPHWQGWVKFNRLVDLKAFKNKHTLSHIEKSRSKKGVDDDYLDKSELSFSFDRENISQKNISQKGTTALNYFIEKIRNKELTSFDQLNKLGEGFFWTHRDLLKNIWNYYNPIKQIEVSPCRTIWLYGAAGSGKTTWTQQYLLNNKFRNEEVATIAPQQMSYNWQVYFDISYENKKVLIINEVDKSFPRHNNLISFIDRNVLLQTKGSYIRNDFELIIINSIFRPEEVFSYLGQKVGSQIMRRLFDKNLQCLVYEVTINKSSLNKAKRSDSFFRAYQPKVRQHKKPDYTLLELDEKD